MIDPDLALRIVTNMRIAVSGCWEWQGSVDSGGYGHMRYQGKTQRVHRLAYSLWRDELATGPGDHSSVVMHTCDNRRCCKPSHLVLGTQAENVADMEAKCRAVHLSGSENGRAILTPQQVEQIIHDPRGTRSIAKDYPVSRSAIQRIKAGKAWTCHAM